MTNPHRDLAAIITVAVREIVTTAAPTEVWDCVEAYLRDQIDELKRQLAAERNNNLDA
jgi:hypothetical protein